MDNSKIFKIILSAIAIYFLLHIAFALADTVSYPDGTVHNCFRTSIGTIVCI
jgi:hypothetical protein